MTAPDPRDGTALEPGTGHGGRISVIVPAFNRGASIRRAIDSIAGRSGAPVEVIVVDDGSTDDTAAAAHAAGERAGLTDFGVIGQANAGPGAARNRGAAAARGGYLAFLDSDDYWLPWTLQICETALAGGQEPALVFLQTVDVEDRARPGFSEGAPVLNLFPGFLQAVDAIATTRYGSCNVIIRRDVFKALGGFTAQVRCSEDTDLFLRAANLPCLVITGLPLVAHVQGHGDRLTGNFAQVADGLAFLLARDRAGLYPGVASEAGPKARMLAKSVVHTICAAFRAGRPGTAYRLYLCHLRLLLRARDWRWLVRLPLYPLLHLLRPGNYPMRWRTGQKEE